MKYLDQVLETGAPVDSLTQVRGKVVVTHILCCESRNSASALLALTLRPRHICACLCHANT